MGEERTGPSWVLSAFSYQLLALCLACLSSSTVLSAATWCTIEVDVSDGKARALGEVDVRAESPVLFGVRSLVTDGEGRAVLLGLPGGSYRLEISRTGYQWLEVQDVQCRPGGVARLVLVLEETEGEEDVVLPSGPAVDPGKTAIGTLLPRAALDQLPQLDSQGGQAGGVRGRSNESFLRPVEANAFEGIIRAGFSQSPGKELIVVPRSPETGMRGRASLEVGAGRRADPTGTRGGATGLDDILRARISLGGKPAAGNLGAFFTFETNTAGLDNRVALSDGRSGNEINRQLRWDSQSILAYGVVGWAPAPENRVDLRLNWGRVRQSDADSSLYVLPDAPIPVGDREHADHRLSLGWDGLISHDLMVRAEVGYSETIREWNPINDGVMRQDQSPEGSWSNGWGNGIWAGEGGVAGFDQAVDEWRAEAGLEWTVGSEHRLGFETSWSRGNLDFKYSEINGDVGLGTRMVTRGPVEARWDTLVSPEASRGALESQRIALRDVWRAGPGLTVILGLEGGAVDFDTMGDGPGYAIDPEDTLSPRLALVWDFEGFGRSRAWVRWARFRQGPGEAVRLRLTGALDVDSTFVGDDGNLRERPAGPIAVSPDLEPARIDETVVGVEYEFLSHLAAGVAGALMQNRGHLVLLTEDGGRSYCLDTPEGEHWPERLTGESVEAWAWVHKRFANGWQARMILGWRQSRGTWEGPPEVDPADLDREYLSDVFSPAALEGAWGPLPDDRRWHVELDGSWHFAAGPALGGRLTYRSGAPVSRLGALADGLGLDRRFVDGRGRAGRTPELWRLDLVGSWPLPMLRGHLEVFAEISNLLGSQTALRTDERWTVLDEVQAAGLDPADQRTTGTWDQPLVVQRPLEARIGLTYRW